MAYNIGAKLSLDGQSEFKEALSQSARALRTLDSELNAVKETSGEGQSEIDALTQQQEILKNKGEILSDTMKKVEEELKNARKNTAIITRSLLTQEKNTPILALKSPKTINQLPKIRKS